MWSCFAKLNFARAVRELRVSRNVRLSQTARSRKKNAWHTRSISVITCADMMENPLSWKLLLQSAHALYVRDSR
uniref:Uncharacterized protein n=1 Tax=viral metagenome TaxID=1070528 RepID=A0A6C0C2H1_9ZZZZ